MLYLGKSNFLKNKMLVTKNHLSTYHYRGCHRDRNRYNFLELKLKLVCSPLVRCWCWNNTMHCLPVGGPHQANLWDLEC